MARKRPIVGVVMGSDSDLETMRRCMKQLDEFGIVHEVRIISAHRTPDTAHEYAATAIQRGLKVIIAAAGMSAALGGVLAANTTLPVVGVPMASGPLVGVDAAMSTMQMPPGIPVACMAIGGAGATNAAIYAAEILATSDKKLAAKLSRFKKAQARKVAKKDSDLRKSLQA
ncbi:MAG: 5-(carboxyamino)imidazole ribonucleotide mutase [Phycisphaerae bacterium]|jgi:phosphoribosylaminoimidazole carboxylase PurE protein|nr:5-(carboxyamino)imidazole ribonucleotide mutase [Phycisphaerae bacterium]